MEGIERIKVLASEVKDKAVLKIVDYLLSRTDMNEKYLNEEKSLKQMISYIKGEAQKQSSNGMAMIEDDEVYSWAIHYWDETNENLGLVDKKVEPKKQEKNIKLKEEEQTTEDEIIKEANDVVENCHNQQKIQKKEWIPEGQLSLFD